MTTGSKPAPASTELAVDRTRLAHERTMMAWTRTATSLISFGFTIYKFLDSPQEQGTRRSNAILGPRAFGMFMILTGLVALALATIEHRRSIKELRAMYGSVPISLSAILAGLIAVLGVLSLIALAFHL